MSIFDQGNLGLYKQALTVRTQQIEAITSNIANEHTPGYKAKQVSFETLVTQSTGINNTHKKHISIGSSTLEFSSNSAEGLDQNNVDGLQERMNFVEVAGQYQLVQEFLSGHMSGLKTAFKGRD